MSLRDERIHQALETLIQAVPGTTIAERNRNRPEQLEPGGSALVLIDGLYDVIEHDTSSEWCDLAPVIEGYVRSATSAELGPALSALHGAVLAAILADKTLGGTALWCREQKYEPTITRDASASAEFSMTLDVRFTYGQQDPTTSG